MGEEGSIGSGDTHTVHLDVLGANPMLNNAMMFDQQTQGQDPQAMQAAAAQAMQAATMQAATAQAMQAATMQAAAAQAQTMQAAAVTQHTQAIQNQAMNGNIYGTPQGMLANPYMQRANFPRPGLGRGGGADNYAMTAVGPQPLHGLAEPGWGAMVIDNQGPSPQGTIPPGPPERGWGAAP
jgi:hypothetical protein